MPDHYAIKHPIHLDFQEADIFIEDTVQLTGRDAQGNACTIIATRRRWEEVFSHLKPSRQEQAKNMYVRGEIELEDFERVL